jgi:PAS domain S-box-containing protein
MLAGTIIRFSSVEELPPEAARDREVWRHYGIKSVVAFPLSTGGGQLIGVLGFNAMREERTWPDEIVNRLQLVAQIFANALARKEADKALRESEERLSLAADSAGAGLWSLDLASGRCWLTEKARELCGIAADEVVTFDRVLGLIHPDDREQVRRTMQAVVESGEAGSAEYRIIRADGSVRWLVSWGRVQSDDSGKPDCLMGASVDITGRKQAEGAFKESEAKYRRLHESMMDAFVKVDMDGRLVEFNEVYRSMLGYTQDELRLRTYTDLTPERWHAFEADIIENQVVRRGYSDIYEKEYRRKDGAVFPVELRTFLLKDEAGTPIAMWAVVRDITERRRMERQLQDRLREIEELKERLERENIYLRQEARLHLDHKDIVGSSKALTTVLAQVEQVAPTDSTVLLLGETGTGKELIAQSIHHHSKRKDRVMVKVDCASLPAALIENELFGREKGAYTGALMRQVGRFEVADGSTIFLDEVGELPLELQARLLRMLQDGEFERLGSPRTIKVDVRVIAATNRNLPEAVKKGGFREDLYYRLNVFPILVPPLRERPEDIPLLVKAFVNEFSGKMGKRIKTIPKGSIEALQRYHWPGNIRELRNVIEQAVIISDSDTLRINVPLQAPESPLALLTLEEAEYMHIMQTLEKTGWRIKGPRGAAALLGLKP